MYTEEQEILDVMKALLSEIEQSQNGAYPTFHPDRIEVLGKGNVRFEKTGQVSLLKLALKELAVTVYHYLTGQSELNNVQMRMDGHPPLEDVGLWSILEPLLKKQVVSTPHLRRQLDEYNRFKKEVKTQQKKARRKEFWQKLGSSTWGVLLSTLRSLRNPLRQVSRRVKRVFSSHDYIVTKWILGILIIAEVIWYWIFNWYYSWWLGMTFLSIVLILGAIIIVVNQGEGNLGDRTAFILCTFAMVLYAATSFGRLTTNDDVLLIDRKSNEVVARLMNENDDRASIEHDFVKGGAVINHFRYRIEPGLDLPKRETRSFNLQLSDRYRERLVTAYFSFRLLATDYQNILEKFKTGGKFREFIYSYIDSFQVTADSLVKAVFAEHRAGYQDSLRAKLMKSIDEVMLNLDRIKTPSLKATGGLTLDKIFFDLVPQLNDTSFVRKVLGSISIQRLLKEKTKRVSDDYQKKLVTLFRERNPEIANYLDDMTVSLALRGGEK